MATTAPRAAASAGSGGAPAVLGILVVGWTTAAAGTVGRRRIENAESARWAAEWARVEPVWSGRVH